MARLRAFSVPVRPAFEELAGRGDETRPNVVVLETKSDNKD